MARRAAALALVLSALLLGAPAPATAQPQVERVAGSNRIETALAASRAGWERSPAAVLATATEFPDALVGGPLAARLDAPLLLTAPDELTEAVAAELTRLGVERVWVLGGPGAISVELARQILALPTRPTVHRVAGRDRFGTAAAAAGGFEGDTVVLASGERFPDALAGSSLPDGAERSPVLLAAKDRLPQATADLLWSMRPRHIVVVGGTAALAPSVAAAAAEAAPGARVTRVAGPTRYATCAAVLHAALQRVDGTPRPLVVATGAAFPDALAAGALAARLDGLVVVTPRFRLDDRVNTLLRASPRRFDRAVVLGGEAAVDRDVLAELDAGVAGRPRPPAALHAYGTDAGFRGTARPLPPAVVEEMRGVSWREGCPVSLADLALLALTHRDFEGRRVDGELVVDRDVAREVLVAFGAAYDARFPIARMRRVDAYGGDDDASMAANNTSAFNCRRVAGSSTWSQHAYGTAVDINPVQNPYVRGATVSPEAGRAFVDRGVRRPGMLFRGERVVDAFRSIGWGWGGDWDSARDYQHFSRSGR